MNFRTIRRVQLLYSENLRQKKESWDLNFLDDFQRKSDKCRIVPKTKNNKCILRLVCCLSLKIHDK